MTAEKIDFNLNDFDEQLTSCTFDSQFFDSDEIGENSQLTDSDKSSNASKKMSATNDDHQRPTSSSNGHHVDRRPDVVLINEDRCEMNSDFNGESWTKFTGVRFRQFSITELDAFSQPFSIGWKRELLVRDSSSNSAKKTVEVQYISPSADVRLRSYVETGLYFRTNQQTELEPENFTFAKQPVHRRPNETVVYLRPPTSTVSSDQSSSTLGNVTFSGTSNGSSLPPPPSLRPLNMGAGLHRSSLTSLSVSSRDSIDLDQSSSSSAHRDSNVSEVRSKRRRNAPSRFEDEDYSEQNPFKKKIKNPVASSSLLTSKPGSLTLKISTGLTLPKLNPIVKDATRKELTIESEVGDESDSKPRSPTRNVSKESEPETDDETSKESALEKPDESIGKGGESKEPTPVVDDSELSNLDKLCTGELLSLKANGSAGKKGVPVTKPNSRVRVWNLKDLKGPQIVIESKDALKLVGKSLSKPEPKIMKKIESKNIKPEPKVTSKPEVKPGVETFSVKRVMKDEAKPENELDSDDLDDEPSIIANEQLMIPFEVNENGEPEEEIMKSDFVPPCSIMCGGRQGNLPSLLCSRCLCLFHPECVSKGIYLRQTGKFVCPNCIQPSDDGQPRCSNNSGSSSKEAQSSAPSLNAGSSVSLLRNRLDPSSKSILKMPLNGKSRPPSLLQPRKILLNLQGPIKSSSLAAMLQRTNGIKTIQLPIQASSSATLRNALTGATRPVSTTAPTGTTASIPTASTVNVHLLESMAGNLKPQQAKSSQPSLLHTLKNGVPQMSITSTSDPNSNSIANRKFHLENLNRTLLSSQNLLQSLHKLGAVTTVQPIRHHSAQAAVSTDPNLASGLHVQRVRKPVRQRCREYMNRHRAGIDSLMSGYNAFQLVFQHLNTRDLMRCKLVNRAFNNMAGQMNLWHSIQLKNMRIRDWDHFGLKICHKSVTDLCFDGMRPCSQESTEQMWRKASTLFSYLGNIRRLSFGQVPMSFLQRLLDHARAEKTFDRLQELSVRNLFDDSPQIGSCRLRFVEQLSVLPALDTLRIASLSGIRPDSCCLHQLRQLTKFVPALAHLYLPSLKGFAVEQFDFIERLGQLESLEIGSCESWITGEALVDTFSADSDSAEEPTPSYRGVFKYLCRLTNVRHLKLIDVIVDDTSDQFPLTLQKMPVLRSLELDGVTVSPDATQTLNLLCNTLKTRLSQLRRFGIATDDSHTNRCVFELLLKRLDNVRELRWKVGSQVDDSGMCCVPFMQENDFDSDLEAGEQLDLTTEDDQRIEMMEMCYLNDVLQKHLQRTQVSILPQ
jgi:hypothetical protein